MLRNLGEVGKSELQGELRKRLTGLETKKDG
jgi:hypothetical protein